MRWNTIKHLEESISRTLSGKNHSNMFFGSISQSTGSKNKNKQMEPNQIQYF